MCHADFVYTVKMLIKNVDVVSIMSVPSPGDLFEFALWFPHCVSCSSYDHTAQQDLVHSLTRPLLKDEV